MFTFAQYLTEANIRFANAKDVDFYGDIENGKETIITFTKDGIANYKEEGKTHGLWSHALKHLVELDSSFVDNVCVQVKGTMIEYLKEGNYPREFEFRYFTNKTVSKTKNPLKLVNTATRESIINFLDMINDKVISREKLAPVEEKMVKYLKTIGDEYAKHIESIRKASVDLDSAKDVREARQMIRDASVFAFSVIIKNFDGDGTHEKKFIISVPDRAIVIENNHGVNTCFQISDCMGGKVAVVRKVFERWLNRRVKVKSALAFGALRSI